MSEKDKKLIALEIPNNLNSRLKLEAFHNDLSISAMIRTILLNYFDDAEDKIICFKTKEQTYDKLQQIALSYGVSVAEMLEILLENYTSK